MSAAPLPPLLRMSPLRAVVRVAWPMVALGWLQALNLAIDTWWVGQLGDAALTGLAGASFAWWIVVQLGDLASLGVHSRVARAIGADRPQDVRGWAAHGLLVTLAVWALLVTLGPLLVPAYLDAVGLHPGPARASSSAFLVAALVAALAVFLQQIVAGVFRGLGDMRTALVIAAVGLAVHAALDPFLIWGVGPLPALGVAGAAAANGCASLVAAGLGVVLLVARRRLVVGPVAITLLRAREIVRIGLPLTVSGVGFSLVYVVLGRMITSFGEPFMASLGVGHRLESFTYLASIGFAIGTSTLVGQHVGAGDVAGAHRAVRTATLACSALMILGTLFAIPAAPTVYRWFTSDPEIVTAGATYLRLQAAVWVFMGLEVIHEGAFAGAGHTTPALWIGGGLTLARIPLAALLAWGLGLGVTGVWLAICLSTLAKGVVLAVWFARGTWEGAAARADRRLVDS